MCVCVCVRLSARGGKVDSNRTRGKKQQQTKDNVKKKKRLRVSPYL